MTIFYRPCKPASDTSPSRLYSIIDDESILDEENDATVHFQAMLSSGVLKYFQFRMH